MGKREYTPEQKARNAELQKKLRHNRTAEQRARDSIRGKELRVYQTPEQKAHYAKLRREQRANRTPEQIKTDKEFRAERWANRTPEQVALNAERHKVYAEKWQHLKRYGVELKETIDKYGTYCNCCGHTPSTGERQLVTDHCHTTGKVRGRICYNCNVGIGHLGDTLEGAEQAVKYLKRNGDINHG